MFPLTSLSYNRDKAFQYHILPQGGQFLDSEIHVCVQGLPYPLIIRLSFVFSSEIWTIDQITYQHVKDYLPIKVFSEDLIQAIFQFEPSLLDRANQMITKVYYFHSLTDEQYEQAIARGENFDDILSNL